MNLNFEDDVVTESMQLPSLHEFSEATTALDLPLSCSELHGVMCGYLVANESRQGESYLRALMLKKSENTVRDAAKALFAVYAATEQQLMYAGLNLQLMLPDDDASLFDRARAFSEWCEGFSQSMVIAGIGFQSLKTEDAQEALQHISEFANLDYDEVIVNEEDECALMEVMEYTRMAIFHLYEDIRQDSDTQVPQTRH